MSTKTEFKAVVTLTVTAPPRVTVTAAGLIATSAVGYFVTRIPVAMGMN